MWRRIACTTLPIVVLAVLIARDGAPWATLSGDQDAGRETSSSSAPTDDGASALLDQSNLAGKDDCCLIADPLDQEPRAGCGDPAIEACVCLHRLSCCEDIWDFDCVIETPAARGLRGPRTSITSGTVDGGRSPAHGKSISRGRAQRAPLETAVGLGLQRHGHTTRLGESHGYTRRQMASLGQQEQ